MIHGHIFLSEDNSEVDTSLLPCACKTFQYRNCTSAAECYLGSLHKCSNYPRTEKNKTNKQIEEKMFHISITKRNEIINKKHYKPVRLQTNDSLLSFRLFAE